MPNGQVSGAGSHCATTIDVEDPVDASARSHAQEFKSTNGTKLAAADVTGAGCIFFLNGGWEVPKKKVMGFVCRLR